MSRKLNSEIAVIRIDFSKNSFRHVGPGSALQPCQRSKLAGTPKTKEHGRGDRGSGANSSPITYMANGKQYVALTVGNGGAQAMTFPPLVPEIQNPSEPGAAIWVFELAD
jgi:hypothetical protein